MSAPFTVNWVEESECSGVESSLRVFRRPPDGGTCEVKIQLSAEQQQERQQGQERRQQPLLWSIEHRWQRPKHAGVLVLRLLSLAERDTLRLASLNKLPPPCNDAAPFTLGETTEDSGGPAAPGAATEAAAGLEDAAGAGSQMDEIRGLLRGLTAGDGSDGNGSAPPASGAAAAAADPKRSLMAAIARSVLQQPSASASRQAAQAAVLAAPQQRQWLSEGPAQHGAHMQQQLGGDEEGEEPRQQPPRQQQPHQQEVAAALQRLEGRVATLERLCHEMHGMLRQLVATQGAQPAAPA
ncbi:hypothetical protein ABPG77_008076 [Micractinium sp. CCAP 211/92]